MQAEFQEEFEFKVIDPEVVPEIKGIRLEQFLCISYFFGVYDYYRYCINRFSLKRPK